MARTWLVSIALFAGLWPSPAAPQADYTIPEFLTPLSTWRDGYSLEETLRFRRGYADSTLTSGADDGAYAITHLTEVLPAAIVHRAGSVSELSRAAMPEIQSVVATTALGTMSLREMIDDERSRLRAIVVVHQGRIVFEEYPALRAWDNHIWGSAAKTVAGLVVHLLSEEGLVDLAAPVGRYVPELADTEWADVPVSEVLHQRSGLDILESDLGDPAKPATRFYATFAGASFLPEDASYLDAIRPARRLMEPGRQYQYSSLNTYVAGLIAEKVTGRPLHDVVTERIWSRAGMEGDAVLGLSPGGEPSLFGIYASRLRDLARYALLFTPSWNVVASEPLVGPSYLPAVYAAARPEVYAGNTMSDRLIADFGVEGIGASYQWDAVFPDGDLYKSGRGGQCIYVSPDTDTVVVYFSAAYQGDLWVHAYAREIVTQLFR